MAHKAGNEFFDSKRHHSRYKDLILSYYLEPYLQKVKRIGKPVILVDLFAGPGVFKDGSIGSPIILLRAALKIAQSGHSVRVILVEKDKELFDRLRGHTQSFGPIADLRHTDCDGLIPELTIIARESTMLLYIDPFSTPRIRFEDMSKIYREVGAGSSVEVLLVLMASTIMRWAAACLVNEESAEALGDKFVVGEDGTIDEMMLEALWGPVDVRRGRYVMNSKRHLTALSGGDYWETIARDQRIDFAEKVNRFVDGYVEALRRWFKVSFAYPIMASPADSVSEYSIVFASRFEPSIDLVNGAMTKARREQLKEWESVTLFSEVLPPPSASQKELTKRVLNAIGVQKRQWREIRWAVSTTQPGQFTPTEINIAIKSLLLSGDLIGATGEKIEEEAVLCLKQS